MAEILDFGERSHSAFPVLMSLQKMWLQEIGLLNLNNSPKNLLFRIVVAVFYSESCCLTLRCE